MAASLRDPTILHWPSGLAPQNPVLSIDRPLWKGPKPLAGREQYVMSSAGGWTLSYESVPIWKLQTLPQYRAVWGLLAGGGAPVYVSAFDRANSPASRAGASTPTLLAFSTGVIFSTGVEFTRNTGDCLLAAAAAQNATQLSINNSSVAPVTAGDYFELNGRLHVITGIWPGTPTLIDIWPPTRAAYALNTPLEIDDPRFLAYLTPDSAALSQKLDFAGFGYANFDFTEASW
jgi:hypothetical protein